jgi:pimeloyl-ACP methyl ester carboxylesterase
VLVDMALRARSARKDRIKSTMIRSAEGLETLDDRDDESGDEASAARNLHKLDSVTRNVRLGGDGNFHWHWDPRLDAREPDVCARRIAAARQLTLPTLLVRGSHPDSLSEDGVTDFLASCAHCEHATLAGGGPRPPGHHDDPFVQVVLEFLRRHVPVVP